MSVSLPVLPGPSAADCCPPRAGLRPALDAERLARTAKALSEPVRVHIVDVLLRSPEPVCQCEFVALFETKQSLLSHHLRKLVEADLVVVERRHKWAYYSIAPNTAKELSSWLT
jgi:ArsR family transcriptional regulator